MRLDRLLSNCGLGSRRQVAAMIRRGRVSVGGSAVTDPSMHVDDSLEIALDGRAICADRFVYIMMNKPRGVVCSTREPGAATVIDILPPELRRPGLFPAGRLDKDSEGLLIITNDGGFAHAMLSPKKHVSKVYQVQLDRAPGAAEQEAFARGVTLEDGYRCRPALLEIGDHGVFVTISEGKYHQVRRMFAACGFHVESLRRVRIGSLELDPSLAPGQARPMSEPEKKAALV